MGLVVVAGTKDKLVFLNGYGYLKLWRVGVNYPQKCTATYHSQSVGQVKIPGEKFLFQQHRLLNLKIFQVGKLKLNIRITDNRPATTKIFGTSGGGLWSVARVGKSFVI